MVMGITNWIQISALIMRFYFRDYKFQIHLNLGCTYYEEYGIKEYEIFLANNFLGPRK